MPAPRLPQRPFPLLQSKRRMPLLALLQQGWPAGLTAAALALSLHGLPAAAQREVPKIGSICPMGYVDLLNGKCSTLGLMTYTVQPTNGEACPSGWMNVGGGYCRKK